MCGEGEEERLEQENDGGGRDELPRQKGSRKVGRKIPG